MDIEYILYAVIALLISIVLLLRARNRAFLGLFLFWLFGSPIFLNPKYIVSLSFLGMDIQPNRFLFIVLTPALYVFVLTRRRMSVPANSIEISRLSSYERFLLGYILVIVFALALNIDSIGSRRVIADGTNAVTFLVVYFCSKQFIKEADFVLVQAAILIFASISAFVGIYQFFVNPEFFRLGAFYSAFLGYYRSNGLFTAEYDQGLFLNLSIIVAASMNLKRWIKVFFVAFACMGIFVTMHRLSWAALILLFGLIRFLYLRRILLADTLAALILICSVYVALNIPWSNITIGKFGSRLIFDRILVDTMTVRVNQYRLSFDMLEEYPLGIGTYETRLYTQIAYNHGLADYYTSESYRKLVRANIVHNGILSAGVKYGILGLILFSLFIFTSILDFLKRSAQKGQHWYPLLMIMIVFLVFNLTNDFSFPGTQIGVALAWIMGGYAAIATLKDVDNANAQPTG